jgi:hypothetical protein
METHDHYISIWFFIGALLTVYGLLILGAGIYGWIVPPERPTAMAHLHPGVWWGALLLAVGALYSYLHFPGRR